MAREYGGLRPSLITLDTMDLRLFGSAQDPEPPIYRSGEDFVAVLGSLLFRGERVPQCLPRLLNEFDVGHFAWQELLGTYTLIVKKGGRLHVATDGLGASKIYQQGVAPFWSNSFLAMCEAARGQRLDVQACYEYVINGSVFGTRTLLAGVSSMPANSVLSLERGEASVTQKPDPVSETEIPDSRSLDGTARFLVGRLDKVFGPLAAAYGDDLRVSFSGGFDSRLMLACLLKFGTRPRLFSYGRESDDDVRIARMICAKESLSLEVIDKSSVPAPEPQRFVHETAANLFAFDGWKVEQPLFDFGADRRDRVARHSDGSIPLNGSLGEIYRNFFYMPDTPSSTGAVISTFYSPFDPAAFTGRFDETRYRRNLAESMRQAIGADSNELTRRQVEQLYPKFRGRFWTGRDAAINQRFGPMFFPFLEPEAISRSSSVPLRYKNLGRLQGRMIAIVNERLAGYTSDYGFPLDGARPLKYRISSFLSTNRPPGIRKLSFRLKHRTMEPRSGALDADLLGTVIDLQFPLVRTLFVLENVKSATQFGLIATLEYLAEQFGFAVEDG